MRIVVAIIALLCSTLSQSQVHYWSYAGHGSLGLGIGKVSVVEPFGYSKKFRPTGTIAGLSGAIYYHTDNVEFGLRCGAELLHEKIIGVSVAELRVGLHDGQFFDQFSIGFGKGWGSIRNNMPLKAQFAFIGGFRVAWLDDRHEWSLRLEERLQMFHVKFMSTDPYRTEPIEAYHGYNFIGLTLSRDFGLQ